MVKLEAGRQQAAGVWQGPTWLLQGPIGAERPTCPRWDTGEGPEPRRGLVLQVAAAAVSRWLWRRGSLGPLSCCSWVKVWWRAEAILAWCRRS